MSRTRKKIWQTYRDEDVQGQIEEKKEQYRLKALNDKQALFMKEIETNTITIATGSAGTGKTYVGVGVAAQMLQDKRIDKILITRPMIACGEEIGWLPGEMDEKIKPWMRPMMDVMNKFFEPNEIHEFTKNDVIEVCPLGLMRGLSYHNSVMILDEAQNCDFMQLKMFLTRIGQNSRMIICADTKQSDLNYREPPLIGVIEKIRNITGVSLVKFTKEDVVRSGIVREILIALED